MNLVTIDVDRDTVLLMQLFGFVTLGSDNVYDLTESGKKMLKDYCHSRLVAKVQDEEHYE